VNITPNVHALKHGFSIPLAPGLNLPRFVYSFVIFGEEGVYLIDSGVAGAQKPILEFIREHGRSPGEVKLLLLTHSHADHIGGAAAIREETGCRISAHPAEKGWIEDIDEQFSRRPVPGFKTLVARPVAVDAVVADGETIEPEPGLSLRVIHTPGHSRGSISLFSREERVLICGDALALPGDLPIYEDAPAALNSLIELKKVRDADWLLSSWAEPVPGSRAEAELERGIGYLKAIHRCVREIENAGELAPMDLCRRAAEALGLPPAAVNPLVAASLQSHVANRDNPLLL